jgi:hypothetical protein
MGTTISESYWGGYSYSFVESIGMIKCDLRPICGGHTFCKELYFLHSFNAEVFDSTLIEIKETMHK